MLINSNKVASACEKDYLYELTKVRNPFGMYDNETKRYSYYSTTQKHTASFLAKRIIQFLGARYDITFTNVKTDTYIKRIDLAIDSLEHDGNFLEEHPLEVDYYYLNYTMKKLLSEHSYSNHSKHRPGVIERADATCYGGGYGIQGTWAELFDLLIVCYREDLISKYALIFFLETLRNYITKNGYQKSRIYLIKSAESIMEAEPPLIMDDQIFDRGYFEEVETKLNELYEQKLFHSNSEIMRKPEIIIPKIVTETKTNQQAILKKIIR